MRSYRGELRHDALALISGCIYRRTRCAGVTPAITAVSLRETRKPIHRPTVTPPRIDQKIAQPGVPSGNEELRQLNRSRESEQRDELKQTALRIANSKSQSRCKKDRQMLK